MIYRTKKNDVLDQVCFDHYGNEGLTEVVLEANRGLAAYGPLLPSNVNIYLPPQPNSETRTISLFDV